MKETDLHLLTKVAVLYYREELTHRAIAKRLGVSRQSVGRMLERAKHNGVIQIKIESPVLHCTELETELEKQFDLKEAVVVTPAIDSEDSIKMALGKASAEFLQRRVLDGDILGVSWGSTVLECVHYLQPTYRENVTVTQLNGSMDLGDYSTRAEYIVEHMARAFNARAVMISAPMLVDRPEILNSLLSDSRISATMEIARNSNIALFGVGDVTEKSSPYKAGYFDQPLIQELQNIGVVGEICGRFFDVSGNIAAIEFQQRTLAVELENLRNKQLSIAICGKPKKTNAIMGMLNGKFCNVLITDEYSARSLIEQLNSKL
jgi:deoxyribonucleoside regulator